LSEELNSVTDVAIISLRKETEFIKTVRLHFSGQMDIVPLKKLVEEATAAFAREFGGELPTVGASAPGRVNIIGEHTDYNDGFVLPMVRIVLHCSFHSFLNILINAITFKENSQAIPLWTVVVGRPNGKETIGVLTLAPDVDEPRKVEFYAPSENRRLSPGNPKWANYFKGVVEHFPSESFQSLFKAVSSALADEALFYSTYLIWV